MIVALCGAYRNAGDHLIGSRARTLLRTFVDPDVVTVDRQAIGPETYQIFNRARAVVLCGGPAYQKEIFPKVYPLDLDKVKPPVIPLGLGWKSPAAKKPEAFAFQREAEAFIKGIHAGISTSSVRDPLTKDVLNRTGVDNVLMTGCPAWYDLASIEKSYAHKERVRTLVFSMPAIMQPGVVELLDWLTQRFPSAERVVSFHHGVVPNKTAKGRETGRAFLRFAAAAKAKGWLIEGLAGSLSKLIQLYGRADLHIGYRVHAHIFCLSRRTASVLINEDARGVGQCMAFGAPNLTINGADIEPITGAIEAHFSAKGEGVRKSVAIMRDTLPTMKRFLATI